MRSQHNGLPILLDLLDDVPELSPARRIDSSGRFVHEEDGRVSDQGHGHVQLPLVAAGVCSALFVSIPSDVCKQQQKILLQNMLLLTWFYYDKEVSLTLSPQSNI
jgi:hypothetical protein